MGPPRKIGKIWAIFGFFRPTEKMGPDGPKWGQEDFFLANPDLADILGRTDLDFENFYFWDFLASQISRFPGSKILDFPISKFLDFPIPRFSHGGRAQVGGPKWAQARNSGP